MSVLAAQIERVRSRPGVLVSGRVNAVRGLTVRVGELQLPVGSLVAITSSGSESRPVKGKKVEAPLLGEVVGFEATDTIVMPLGQTLGIRSGDIVRGLQVRPTILVGDALLGRTINGLGEAIDGDPPPQHLTPRPLSPEPISALSRERIREPIRSGVRAVDLLLTLGRGQRVGVFAGPGVGKSTLLGTVARSTSADVNVIALIGERGREVRDFVENSLGEEGLARSVVVVATGDESPLLRIRAALAACTVAEYFRDQGKDVMLMMDSVTRFAHAQRQVGLSVGEPPATKGYTPSVFASLALLLERAGAVQGIDGQGGSITGLYAILVEGDDMTEPVADAARGILDGHVILSRKLAQRGHYPAIDILDSVSRLADEVSDEQLRMSRRHILRLMAAYADVEELVSIGAYAQGSNPEADVALAYRTAITELLTQSSDDSTGFDDARARLVQIAAESADMLQRAIASQSKG